MRARRGLDLDVGRWPWSRLPKGEQFTHAGASDIVSWGDRFVIGGAQDGHAVIWISGQPPAAGVGALAPTSSAEPPAQTPTEGAGSPGDTPASFAGNWGSTDPPPDSSHLTMELIATPDGSYEMTVRDDFASVCHGAPSTMTGVAALRDQNTIVIARPEYTCDDGSEAQALSGPPLADQLRDLTFTYDPQADALNDSFVTYIRAEAER